MKVPDIVLDLQDLCKTQVALTIDFTVPTFISNGLQYSRLF
jgi:hypothetical protein